MQAILKAFWQIALCREGPQNLPESRPLLFLAAGAYFFISLLIAGLVESFNAEPGTASLVVRVLLSVIIDVLGEVVFLGVALYYFSRLHRFQLALSAIFGVGAIQGALLLPCIAAVIVAQVVTDASPLAFLKNRLSRLR